LKTGTVITSLVVVLVLAAGWWTAKLIWFKPTSIDLFFERSFLRFALEDPELLTRLRLLERYGLNLHNAKLTDASDEFARRRLDRARHELAVLRSYDRSRLNPSQRLSADILDWFLDRQVRGEPFLYHDYPVNQLFGVQSELPTFLATMHQINREADARNYIKRLSKFGVKLDQVLDGLKTREAKGIIPPRFVIEKVLAQMRGFVGQDSRSNILFTAFSEKVNKLTGASDDSKQLLLRAADEQIKATVYPAYGRLIDYCVDLLPKTTTDDGVWKLPDGDAYYAHELRSHTTTDMTPEEVHELGLKEVARIESEIRQIFDALGYQCVSIGDCFKQLDNDPRFQFPADRSAGTALLADYETILQEVDRRIGGVFDIRPKVGVKMDIIPEFKEKTSPAAYYNPPSLDGSRPGIFYVNLYPPAAVEKYKMKTLAYHEAIPGHHFQIAIQQELKGVPTFRKIIPFTAYVEGWALYTERLAAECGLYENDPYGNLGRLSFELFRAARLVVDTGIHYKRWTREQAIAYMEERSGLPAETEVERYIVDPGQACAYKIGELKILELREKAKTELGERFDIKEFHNVVLKNGAVPLTILEKLVDDYIAAKKT
jgi:uncharacterized protein (DUF885 family)